MSSDLPEKAPKQPPRAHAIEQATGQAWTEWVSWLEKANAEHLEHQPLAELVLTELGADRFAHVSNQGWWAQAVAISYEQYLGRRMPGQRADGSFEATVSKTIALPRQQVWEIVRAGLAQRQSLFGMEISDARTSHTPKRDYWRATLVPETKVVVALESKDAQKTLITGTSSGLLDNADRQAHKDHWRQLLTELFDSSD